MKKTETKGMKVEVGVTRLYVPHEESEITFIHPPKGPDTYFAVREQLLESELNAPIMSQNASLVYAAWQNPKERYSREIIDTLKNRLLWSYNGILYVPKEGAYIKAHPEVKNDKIVMNKSDLVKKLEENDSSVKFVSFGFKIGELTARELAKNKFIRGLAGEEGAEKLAEVSTNYKHHPFLFSFDKLDEELIRVAALYSYWSDDRLNVVGGSRGDHTDGYVLGVSALGEAHEQKI